MEFIHKIRALQIGKRKTFRRVLLAEILLILLGIVGLFGRNDVGYLEILKLGLSGESFGLVNFLCKRFYFVLGELFEQLSRHLMLFG